MPFKLREEYSRVYKCEVCGRITLEPIVYKTCCMNKPVYFCSRTCMVKWITEWAKNQEQVFRGDRRLRRIHV